MRPWWAERQLDPSSAAYAPGPSRCCYWSSDTRVEADVLANTAGRSWTTIGLPEMFDRAAVDPRGLTVWSEWSLDWWIRSGDEWVFPSRAPAVRQRLIDGMPVVETVLRVGGGDVVHRVAAARGVSYAQAGGTPITSPVRGSPEAGAGSPRAPEVFVVEITNRTPEAVAVALAVRPCNLGAFEHDDGQRWEWSNEWAIGEIALDGCVLSLGEDNPAGAWQAQVIFDREPGDIVVGSHGTDSAAKLVEHSSGAGPGPAADVSASKVSIRGVADADPSQDSTSGVRTAPVGVTCPQRLANAAVIFPLVAGATLRAAVPARNPWFRSGGPASRHPGTEVLDAAPPLERVANGWRKRVEAGCRLELPSGRQAEAVLSARAAELLATAPCDDGSGAVGPMLASALSTDAQFAGDDLVQLSALVESGLPEQVRDLLLRQAQAQFPSGETSSMGVSVTGTSLVLAEHLLSLHPDPAFGEAIGEFAASGARWLLTRDAVRREEPWTIREGLRAGHRLLVRHGTERAADALRREAMRLPAAQRVDVRGTAASPASTRDPRRAGPHVHGRGAGTIESQSFYRDESGRLPWQASWDDGPAPPGQRWEWTSHDTGLWIHGAVPWAPPLPFVTPEPAEGTPVDFVADTAASCGHDLVATALLAFAEARAAPARSFERLEALVSVVSSTFSWPTFVHPQLHTGTNGSGHDLMVSGLFVRALLRLLVDVADDGTPHEAQTPTLRLAAHWPATWLGQPVEVHDVPTRIGKVSWAVRWHGERPALLWDVVPHDHADPTPAVTAPGLDPAFAATGWRGETLLAPHPA